MHEIKASALAYLLYHEMIEKANRTACSECQFESTEGRPESHSDVCSKRGRIIRRDNYSG